MTMAFSDLLHLSYVYMFGLNRRDLFLLIDVVVLPWLHVGYCKYVVLFCRRSFLMSPGKTAILASPVKLHVYFH